MTNQCYSFADSEYQHKKRQTRKDAFLLTMDQAIPWKILIDLIEPFYPKAGNGRQPYPLDSMLRIHCLQQWYNLSDEGMEDALYETTPFRHFAHLDISAIPDRCTIMNFRHLLEKHQLSQRILTAVNNDLEAAGLLVKMGTLMDATIIHAPTSTKNQSGKRDPEMHSTKKGNQWYFGMKSHIGVDAHSGLVHTTTTSAANEHDLNQAQHLLSGEEAFVIADAGYLGAPQRKEIKDRPIDWLIAQRPGQVRALKHKPQYRKQRKIEQGKARLRAPVEHVFRIIKCQFGFTKTRYRGLVKNHSKLLMLYALANIIRAEQLSRTG